MAKQATLRSKHKIDLGAAEFRAMHREFVVEREGLNKEARTVELSFASEQAVDRWFGREILDITADSCDLTRLNNGGAVLVNHEWDNQVGVVTKAWIDGATKKARATVKFSRTQAGEDIFTDIQDGIRSLVSVGYVVRKMVLQSMDGDVETHRVTDWLPFEVSIVSVPADSSVGVGRSQTEHTATQAVRSAPAIRTSMTEDEKRAHEAQELARTQAAEERKLERARVADLNKTADTLATRHPQHKDALLALARKCAETGDDVNVFNRSVLADILKTGDEAAPATRQGDARVGLNEKDRKRYSIMRAIQAKMEGRAIEGLERECSDELAKKLGRSPVGFFLPDEIVADAYGQRKREQRTLVAGNAVDGGYTVPSELMTSEFVEYLRNNTRLVELGARFIGGLQGDVSIPRQLTGASAYWVSETGSITASGATFGQIVAKPRRIGTSVPYSKQFLAQSSLGAEAFVVNDSDRATAVELDRVGISGAGVAEPLGILNLASGDRSTSVTFSGAATWPKYLEFFSNIAANNALLGSPAYLTTPASAAKAMGIPKFSNTATPIWADDKVGTFRALWSTQFPSSPTANQVIFGDFSQVIYLEWAGRDVIVDPYGTNATSGTVTVTIQRLIDMVIRRGKSFAISSDTGAA
jgi:HK97 family phage major capsid protein